MRTIRLDKMFSASFHQHLMFQFEKENQNCLFNIKHTHSHTQETKTENQLHQRGCYITLITVNR